MHEEYLNLLLQIFIEASHEAFKVSENVRVEIRIDTTSLSSAHNFDSLHDVRRDRYLSEAKVFSYPLDRLFMFVEGVRVHQHDRQTVNNSG